MDTDEGEDDIKGIVNTLIDDLEGENEEKKKNERELTEDEDQKEEMEEEEEEDDQKEGDKEEKEEHRCEVRYECWYMRTEIAMYEYGFNSYSANHDNWCTGTLWNRIITAQCEGMGEVGSARYEPALLPPCPSIRVLCYSNCQRSTHSHQQFKG